MNYRIRVLGRKVVITITLGLVTITIELPRRWGWRRIGSTDLQPPIYRIVLRVSSTFAVSDINRTFGRTLQNAGTVF